jgi:hypothetical protein
MIYQANGQLKQTGVAILISHKIDIKSQLVRGDKKTSLHTNKRNNIARENNNCPDFSTPPSAIERIERSLRKKSTKKL